MEIIKVLVVSKELKLVKQLKFAISSWYAKPSILCCLAWFMNQSDAFRHKFLLNEEGSYYNKVLLLICSKYGCRQFLPRFSSSFPVYNIDYTCYKKDLDWITLEFNDNASSLINEYKDFEFFDDVEEHVF